MTQKAAQLAAAGYLLAILYAGLLPLSFDFTQPAEAELHAAIQRWPNGPAARINRHDLWVNVLAFAPAGFLVAAGWMRSRHWTMWLAGGAAGTVVSVAIEAGQLFLPHRVCSLSDVTIDAAAALAGALLGSAFFGPSMRRWGSLAAMRLKGRHTELAAAVLMMALLTGAMRAGIPSLKWIGRQSAAVEWSIIAGFRAYPWHWWIIRCAAVYAALAILLSERLRLVKPQRSSRNQVIFNWSAAAVTIAVAAAVQAMRLFVPGSPPNLAELAMAAAAAVVATMLARPLADGRQRPVEMPAVVLAAALGLAVLLSYVNWISGSHSAKPSLPFWETFWYGDHGWGLYSTLRRMIFAAGMSFLLAFYISLRSRWPLARRMQIALAMTLLALAGAESFRAICRLDSFSVGRLGEHAIAAAAGVILFAATWRILDRRKTTPAAAAFPGPDRRRRQN